MSTTSNTSKTTLAIVYYGDNNDNYTTEIHHVDGIKYAYGDGGNKSITVVAKREWEKKSWEEFKESTRIAWLDYAKYLYDEEYIDSEVEYALLQGLNLAGA